MTQTIAPTTDMLSIAQGCIEIAKKQGAQDAAARAYKSREVSLDWRDGKVERIQESTTRGVGLQLFVDGRYSTVSTSDLRPDALAAFIGDAVVLARSLAKDEFRKLPDPELYKGRTEIDLKLEDPKYDTVTPDDRRRFAKVAEDAARAVKGSEAILSVSTGFGDTLTETFLVTSNGFSGKRRDTVFSISASVSAKDADGRRPEDYAYAVSRFYGELAKGSAVGTEAASRALSRLGAKKGESAAMTMVLDNRASSRLLGYLIGGMGPMTGSALQQKRSCLEGKLGTQVFSEKLTIVDDPLIPKGLGSRHFDMEGISAKMRPIIEAGVLRSYFIDNYYGRKLGVAPTSGNMSNLTWKYGDTNRAGIVAELQDAILVTDFIGGNSNALTGDFSLGVQGYRIRGGKLAEPVAEMNISGNHLEFWKRIAAVGNDPFPYSAMNAPTLVFEGVSFAGV
ncbi:MAG: TldD/PmbA family protein [Thermoanaerobaculia bacterium]|jgi:PmbA protein